LVDLEKDNPYQILIGGDFNLVRFLHEKSKGQFDELWPLLFNASCHRHFGLERGFNDRKIIYLGK
jgi:hypothetical protein